MEGEIFTIITFPDPWPPANDVGILDGTNESSEYSLIAEKTGRIRIDVTSKADGEVLSVTFREIQPPSRRPVVTNFSWDDGVVRLWMNGQDLEPVGEKQRVPVEIQSKGIQLAPHYILPAMDIGRSKSDEELFFLQTLCDLDEKQYSGDPYEVIRGSGILRQLFLDSPTLLDQANRSHRLKFKFVILGQMDPLPETPASYWRPIDPTLVPLCPTSVVSRDQLLSQPILDISEESVTVKDVILACANGKGGVHYGKVDGQKAAILDMDKVFRLLGEEPSVAALRGIMRVVLVGLVPLCEKITEA